MILKYFFLLTLEVSPGVVPEVVPIAIFVDQPLVLLDHRWCSLIRGEILCGEPKGCLMARYKKSSNRSRKRPKNSLTHVARVRLEPTPKQARVMVLRGRACDRIYNACLGETIDV